jgi:hypothetical protein
MMPNTNFLNQVPMITVVIVAFVAFVLYLAVKGTICYLIIQSLQRVPAEHRRIEPAMIWLLLIPCFSLIWNFFVFRRVPDSFASYFAAQGQSDVGDCGKTLGTWYAGLSVAGVAIPLYGAAAGIAALVLLILSLVKYNELKQRIDRTLPRP